MQDNTQTTVSRKKLFKKAILALKIIFFGLMVFYLYQTIQQKGQRLSDVYEAVLSHLTASNGVMLVLVVSLTFLNWTCETMKWQTLAQRVESVSFWQAFGGVFSGLALGFVLPNQVGDAAGRVLSLRSRQRFESIGAALLSNGLQFYVSLMFGTVGWAYFLFKHAAFQKWYNQLLLVLLILTLVLGLLVFVYRLSLTHFLERFILFRKIEPYLIVIDRYQTTEIGRAMRWAVLRYWVFTLQFWLLLQIFHIKLPLIDALAGIFLIFFSKTLLPALNFLGDLGIREAASLFVFGYYGLSPTDLIAATLTLWFINIFLPTLIGTAWLWKLKF